MTESSHEKRSSKRKYEIFKKRKKINLRNSITSAGFIQRTFRTNFVQFCIDLFGQNINWISTQTCQNHGTQISDKIASSISCDSSSNTILKSIKNTTWYSDTVQEYCHLKTFKTNNPSFKNDNFHSKILQLLSSSQSCNASTNNNHFARFLLSHTLEEETSVL